MFTERHEKLIARDQDEELEDPPRRTTSPGKVTRVARLFANLELGASTLDEGDMLQAAEAVARAQRSSGQPLPEELKRELERLVGADLGGVRVHTGEESARAARAVHARAYAQGQDIYFAAGQYQPSLPEGKRLLAHEVAHTVQQSGVAPAPQSKLEVSEPGDPAELEADRAADAIVSGIPIRLSSSRGTALHRDKNTPAGGELNTDQSLEIDLGIPKVPKVKITGNSATAQFDIPESKYPEGAEFEKRYQFSIAFAPGIFGYAAVGVSGSVGQSANISITGTKSGEGENTSWSISGSGSAPIKGEIKATLSLGVEAGCPGFLGLMGEVAAVPTVTLEATPKVTVGLSWSKSGVTGSIEFPGEVKGELFVELVARLLYDVFWKSNPQEFAKYTFGKWIIATCGIAVNPKISLPGGFSIEATEPYANWGDAPKPTMLGGRDPTSFKSEYEKEQERRAKEIQTLKDQVTLARLYGNMDDVRKAQAELNKKLNQCKPTGPPPDALDRLMAEAKAKRQREMDLYIDGKGPEPGPLPSWRELEEQLDRQGQGTPVLVHDGTGSSEIGPEEGGA